MKIAIAAFITLYLVLPSTLLAAEQSTRPPNIIVILADDLGYGDLGCYGHPRFKTPNLDRMAGEGARFTQFNCPMAFCAPTRAALLTGRYPLRCGMTSNPAPDASPEADAIALPAGEVTLAQILRTNGYATAMIGKWHLGHQRAELFPTQRGFDEYLGILYSNDMRPVQLIDRERSVEYPLVQATLTRRYTERALSFMEANRAKPFFLYFAQAMPHKPLAVSEKFYKKSEGGLYGDVMAELDDSVGQVLAKLKELRIDENTFVIFTSDNGPWFGGSTGGLRGMKGSSFEGGYRVPFIARWPEKIPSGKVIHDPAITMDIFATALAVARVPPPADRIIDGRNLLPALISQQAGPHEVIFGQAGARLAAVRDRRWKLHVISPAPGFTIRTDRKWIDARGPDGVTILAPYEQSQPNEYPGLQTGDAPKAMMLFDLESDPSEQHDVAAQNQEVVERLKRSYDAFLASF